MNRGLFVLLSILIAAAAAYGVYFGWAVSKHPETGLEWLQSEYDLSESTLSEIEAAQDRYLPQCREMCARLAKARQDLSARTGSVTSTAQEIFEAYAAVHAIEEECVRMSIGHVFAVADLMPEEKARDYRKRMVRALLGDQEGDHVRHSDRIQGGAS